MRLSSYCKFLRESSNFEVACIPFHDIGDASCQKVFDNRRKMKWQNVCIENARRTPGVDPQKCLEDIKKQRQRRIDDWKTPQFKPGVNISLYMATESHNSGTNLSLLLG